MGESGRQRWQCYDCGHRTTNPTAPETPAVEFKSQLPDKKRFVITAAQNATPIFKPFLDALLRYCKVNDAALIVIPYRYKNPTSQWTANNEDHEWWDEAVVPYLYDGRFNLNDNLVVMADVKVQPTAVTPLSGLDSMTGHRSGIVGHPRLELKTVATPSHKLPKIMTTTGAVTKPNYTDSKAGKKGEFHHSYAAAVVEVKGKVFHLRQLCACADGSFIDLDREYTKDAVRKAAPAEALVMGDIHVDFVDPAVVKATFGGSKSLFATLRPKRVILHDLIDFYSRNHHHAKNPFVNIAKRASSMDIVSAEIERACRFIDDNIPPATKVVLVPSNHVEALTRWISDADWRLDPTNAETYLETALAVVRSIKMTPNGSSMIDPFHYWARKLLKHPRRCIYLKRGNPYSVRGVEFSMHGDQGTNGTRGSRKSLSTIGVKSFIAHGHGPGITDGCWQVGTSTFLKLEYTGGPSNWLQTHGAQYANGKRSLFNIIGGEYRA
ncbi:hypothetical protein [Parvibaculum sp.]|uniref:hypothetical protein n=1 Tax=Parvibaculum sp. TaxID=2024848 RepID=UPI002734B922|nr:hypothetical protein [Parvibaculum sp.]MDP3327200.1 hypothetical protein [Parvibaculum sp.]